MKWVTRERPKIDRIACPWLVERFIDRDAEFLYVPSGKVAAVAAETGAKVSELDTLEVGQGTPTAYLDRMGANLESLRKAFGKGD